MPYISKRERDQKRYAQFVEKCKITRNSDDLLSLMKEYVSSFSAAKDLQKDIMASPAVVKRKTKYLRDYMGKDLYVFGTKDGMVIHVDTEPFKVSSLKRDEVYWHNLEIYSIMKKEAKRLGKSGKKIDLSGSDFGDDDEDEVLELQEHLEESLYTALMVFENNPEGGTQACSDMEEILEKCLKHIDGVVITISNGYTQGNIVFTRDDREIRWEIEVEVENDGIGKIVYVGAHLVEDSNNGMDDIDW
jgi:hypothetical protein